MEDEEFVDENDADGHLLTLSVVVSGLSSAIFDEDNGKRAFESLFRSPDDTPTFFYLKSLKRVRVDYKEESSVDWAMETLQRQNFLGNELKLKKAKVLNGQTKHLRPPKPYRQYLISPPPSPPHGWAQTHEEAPFNFDLVAAVAGLSKEPYELHSSTRGSEHPSIVVNGPDDEEEECRHDSIGLVSGARMHTRRPPMK